MPQLTEDLQKAAAYLSEQNGYTIQRYTDLACDVRVVPVAD